MAEKYVRADVSSRKGGAVTPYQRPLQSVLGIAQPEVHSNKRALQMDAANKLVRGAISAYGAWEDHQRANKADSDQQRGIVQETYKRAIQREGADAISTPEKLQQFNRQFLSDWKEGKIANNPYNADIDDDQLRAKMGFAAEDFVSQYNVGKVSQIQPVSAIAQESFYRKDKGIVKVLEGMHLAKALGTTNFEDVDKAPILNVNPEVLNSTARDAVLSSLAYSSVSTGKEGDFVDALTGLYNRGEISADEYGETMQTFVKLNKLKLETEKQEEEVRDQKAEEYMLNLTQKNLARLGHKVDPDADITPAQFSAIRKQKDEVSSDTKDALAQIYTAGAGREAVLSHATRAVNLGQLSVGDYNAIVKATSVSAAETNGAVVGFKNLSSNKRFQSIADFYARGVAVAYGANRDKVAEALIRQGHAANREQANAALINENGGLIGAHYSLEKHLPVSPDELAKAVTVGAPDELRTRIEGAIDDLEQAHAEEANSARAQKLMQDLTVLRGLQKYYGGPLPRNIKVERDIASVPEDREVSFLNNFLVPIYEFFTGDEGR